MLDVYMMPLFKTEYPEQMSTLESLRRIQKTKYLP